MRFEIKDKIFKRKAGKSKGVWIVRIEYFDDVLGKVRYIERNCEKRSDAIDKRDKLIDDVKKTHGQIQTGERMTFDKLADICEKTFYKPAEIVQGRKVAGIRSYDSVKYHIKNLRSFFGLRLINEITTESLTDYKLWRLKPKSEEDTKTVKIATVNRELSAMRKIMRFAYGKGWVLRDIFFNAKVIDMAAEVERQRILTSEEEYRLLNSCQGKFKRKYTRNWKGKEQEITAEIEIDNFPLKVMIILALDSGLRKGEILKLRWDDFDYDNNSIRIIGTHTKTERERSTPLSKRGKDAIEELKQITKGDKPFPFNSIKHSFATAKDIANIEGLRFHDLRRTAITKWQHLLIPLAQAGKLAGHTELQTTMKHYTAMDNNMITELAEKMNAFHLQREQNLEVENNLSN